MGAPTRLTLPEGFEPLEALAQTWSLSTQNERQQRRITSTEEELQTFYDAIMPLTEQVLALCDQYPVGEMPEPVANLFYMTLSLTEIAPHVELYRCDPLVPMSFEESRFVAVHGDRVG